MITKLISIAFGKTEQMPLMVMINDPLKRLVPWIPIGITLVLCINSLFYIALDGKNSKQNRLIAFNNIFLLSAIALAYVITLINPWTAVDRYVGLTAYILIIFHIVKGIEFTYKNGKLGQVYLKILIILAAFTLAFSGTFTPLNQFSFNPNAYSVYGLITYSDAESLNTLVKLLNLDYVAELQTDWRTGYFITYATIKSYNNIDISWHFKGSIIGRTNVTFIGAYYYTVDEEMFAKLLAMKNLLLVLRLNSISMFECWQISDVYEMLKFLQKESNNVLYDSGFLRTLY
ncbi:MAG: hypothetical protein QXY79_01240 [Candidatus Methanomethylicia archaeon]